MKKYWHIALMLFCVLMITSCGDDDEALEVDEVWKVQNEEAFQAQMLVPGFEQLKSQSNAGFILYKVLKTGESKEPIYYTSKVECYYKGSFINGEVFDDRSFEAGEPAELTVSDMVDGFCYSVTEYAPRRSLGDLDSSTDGIRFGWKECFGKCHNKALYDFDL